MVIRDGQLILVFRYVASFWYMADQKVPHVQCATRMNRFILIEAEIRCFSAVAPDTATNLTNTKSLQSAISPTILRVPVCQK